MTLFYLILIAVLQFQFVTQYICTFKKIKKEMQKLKPVCPSTFTDVWQLDFWDTSLHRASLHCDAQGSNTPSINICIQ